MKNEIYLQSLINLLTKENITLNLDDVIDALFDLKERILTLPNYVMNFDSVIVNERLVCHEAGHGLFTPGDLFSSRPQYIIDVINALEDIRIENLFKEQFPGSGVLFYKGYMKFMEVYKIETGKDLLNDPKFHKSFINKLMTYFKSNYVYSVNFKENEKALVEDLKTFKDISFLNDFIDRLLNILKENKEEEQQESNVREENYEKYSSPIPNEEEDEDEEDDETDVEDDESVNSPPSKNSSKESNVLSLEEQQSLVEDEIEEEKQQEKFIKNYNLYSKESYLKRKIIFQPEEPLIVYFDQFWDAIPKHAMKDYFQSNVSFYPQIESSSATLSIEFNRLKSAKNFRQVKNIRHGSLDLNKIYGYKTSMDLFSTLKKKPNEKNHEIVILLDWSGSIRSSLFSLAIQTSILFHFCCKNNIGIKVFAFSNSDTAQEKFSSKGESESKNYSTPLIWFELLSSKTTDVKKSIINFLSLTSIIKDHNLLNYDLYFLALGGTPLYRSLAFLGKTLKELYSPDKSINLITLTDGISENLNLLGKDESSWKSSNISVLDLESNKIFNSLNLQNDVSVRSFLFERLKIMIPQLKILHIHVSSELEKHIFDGGLLYLKPTDPKIKILLKKLKSENYVFSQYKDFNSLIYLQQYQEEFKRNELLLDDLKIKSKDVVSKILQTLNNSLSKKIFQKIAENIS